MTGSNFDYVSPNVDSTYECFKIFYSWCVMCIINPMLPLPEKNDFHKGPKNILD